MRKILNVSFPWFVVFALPVMSVCAQAQSAIPVMKDISSCMQLAAEAGKYACYLKLEAEARRPPVKAENQAQSAPVADNNKAGSAAVGNRENAGLGRQVPVTENTDIRPASSPTIEVHDLIAEVKEREPKRWLITLANGQVWYQSNSQDIHLRKGMAVHIYPSPLHGSYRLARDDGTQAGFIQVERVK